MHLLLWGGFLLLVLGLLALDLGVFHRHARAIGFREALGWTVFWIALAMGFNLLLIPMYDQHWLGIGRDVGHRLDGHQAALEFLGGYVLEKSLSLDNIFVIAMVFTYFGVPSRLQHRVLFWGILGALVLRGIMIAAGSALIERFDWVVYLFGALLFLTSIKMMITRHETIDPARNPLVRLARRFYSVTESFEEERFFTRLDGKRAVTPLFLVLLMVESTDVLFAIDSIPAVFAVTRDPFLVFTSNVFAILGLRSLFFALSGLLDRFRYLKQSLVFVLAFVGTKMILSHHVHISIGVSLAILGGILAVGAIASVVAGGRDPVRLQGPEREPRPGDPESHGERRG